MSSAFASNSYQQPQMTEDSVTDAPEKAEKPKKAPSAFRTISEVADELDVQQHVLRFWETKFSQVRPLKRGGGRRYYRPEDLELLKRIYHLLYTEGYTIKGAQKLLKGQGKSQILENVSLPKAEAVVTAKPEPLAAPVRPAAQRAGMSDTQKTLLKGMLDDLRDLRDIIKG